MNIQSKRLILFQYIFGIERCVKIRLIVYNISDYNSLDSFQFNEYNSRLHHSASIFIRFDRYAKGLNVPWY